MSDKGREAIATEIYEGPNNIGYTNALQYADDILAILHDFGWLHESDVVEGHRVCALTLKPDIDLMECPPCACADCPKMRTATVKDLIG